jgi:hypothetical protein
MDRLKKPLTWLVIGFLLYTLFKQPDQAAAMVRSVGDGLIGGVDAIGRFFDAVLAK